MPSVRNAERRGPQQPLSPRPGSEEDERWERNLLRWVPPMALLTAWMAVNTSLGHFLARTFFTMGIHELGHAVTSWLCGHAALPGLWVTWTSEGRSWPVSLLLLALSVRAVVVGRQRENPLSMSAGVALLLAHGIGLPLSIPSRLGGPRVPIQSASHSGRSREWA